jgi:hypothetical protein
MLTLDRTIPVLERISAINSNKPEAAKCKVFDFFDLLLFFFICLLIFFTMPIFYLLFVVINFCE